MNTKKRSALYIVTGTSRGLGEALASQFIKPGNELIAISRTPNASLQKKAEQTGVPFRYIRLDLAQLAEERDAQQLLAGIWAETDLGRFNRLCLINNARGAGADRPGAHVSRCGCGEASRCELDRSDPPDCCLFASDTAHRCGQTHHANFIRCWTQTLFWLECLLRGQGRSGSFYPLCPSGATNEPYGARIASVAPGVVETAMQERIRRTDERSFPDRSRFVKLYETGRTTPPHEVAQRLLSFLDHDDFGKEPVVDIREWKG